MCSVVNLLWYFSVWMWRWYITSNPWWNSGDSQSSKSNRYRNYNENLSSKGNILHDLWIKNVFHFFCGRGCGVEDTRLKAKAKDTKKSEAKDRPSRGQEQKCLRPRTQAQVFSEKKKVFKIFFQAKKVFKNFFGAISRLRKTKKGLQIFREIFDVFQQNFNNSKNTAVLELRSRQFSRTWGFEAKDLTF